MFVVLSTIAVFEFFVPLLGLWSVPIMEKVWPCEELRHSYCYHFHNTNSQNTRLINIEAQNVSFTTFNVNVDFIKMYDVYIIPTSPYAKFFYSLPILYINLQLERHGFKEKTNVESQSNWIIGISNVALIMNAFPFVYTASNGKRFHQNIASEHYNAIFCNF